MRPSISIALVMLVSSTVAHADSSGVRSHAVASYESGDFHSAAGAFATSFTMSFDPSDLFAWAQAERLSDSCDRATKLYSLYVSLSPQNENRKAALEGVALCGQSIVISLTKPDIIETPRGKRELLGSLRAGYAIHASPWFLQALSRVLSPSEDCQEILSLQKRVKEESQIALLTRLASADSRCLEVPEAPPPRPAEQPQAKRSWLDSALLYGGAAAIVTGGAVWGLGTHQVTGASGNTYGQFEAEVDRARRLQWIGGVTGAIGVSALAMGLWRTFDDDPPAEVQVGVSGDSSVVLMLGWSR